MNNSLRLVTVGLFAVTLVISGFVAFADLGGDGAPVGSTASMSTSAAPVPAPEPAPAPEQAPVAFAATIDGADFPIADPRIECVRDPAFTQVTVTSGDESNKNLAAFQMDGEQRVVSVSLSDGSPTTLTVEAMTGEGTANAEVNGDNYRISGEGWNIDYSNPAEHEVKPFTLEVTCS